MTEANRPVTRATHSMVRGRPVVVTIHPTFIGFRLKGTRKEFVLGAVAGYQCAAKLEARQALAAKLAEKRKEKRKA